VEDFKRTVAGNIAALRSAVGLKQSELGEKLNYSDKSISKWERAESLPDAYVLKQMSEIFGVSVDYILTPHEGTPRPVEAEHRYSIKMIALISFVGTWTAALLAFVIVWLTASDPMWQIFAAALPVSMLVLVVFSSIWGKMKERFWAISAFVWSLFTAIFLCCLPSQALWQLFLLAAAAQVIVILSFNVKRKYRWFKFLKK